MPCEGIERLNPLCLPVTVAEAAPAANALSNPFGTIAGFFSSAANNATTWLWDQINEATTLDLNSPQLVREMGMTAAIAAVLCLGLFLIQVITAALRGHPVMLGRALSGLLISFVGSAFALATTRVLLTAVDALSNGVVQFTLGTNIDGLGKKFAFVQLSGVANPATVILVSLVVLASVVVVWAAMMIRKLMILLAAVLAPLAFAGATADITRGWVRKWIEFTAAMIASKLLLVIILSLGVSVLNGAGQSGTGQSQTATQLAGGSLILLLGGLAPWVAIRMFHFAGDSLYAAHSVARQTSAGAQSAIAGPQKVASLQSTARALGGGFRGSGGNGGGTGGGFRGGGTVPPAPPRPALAGVPAGGGSTMAGSGTTTGGGSTGSGAGGGAGSGSLGSGGAHGRAGMAAGRGGAAAATSAAVPVAGAVVTGAAVAGSALKGSVNALPNAAPPSSGGTALSTPTAARPAPAPAPSPGAAPPTSPAPQTPPSRPRS